MTQATKLKELLTQENVQELLDNIIFTDESSAIPINKLDILYAVIKTGMTKPGRRVPLGNIFVPDGDSEEALYDFERSLDGIVISMFQEKNMFLGEEESGLPHCNTVAIPPIMGREGTRYGACAKCSHGKYVEGQVSACLPHTKFIVLREIDGKLALLQVKAKGVSNKAARDAWTAFAGKVRGRTLSHTAVFSTITKNHTAKDGKSYNVDFWNITPGEKAGFSVEQTELIKKVKDVIQKFHVVRWNLYKDIVDAEKDGGAGHMSIETDTTAGAIPHMTPTAPVNQVGNLNIDSGDTVEAEVVPQEEQPAAVPQQKKVVKKAGSDISV